MHRFTECYAGLERFNKTAEAMKRAKAANEPNYQLFTHISQAAIHRVRGEYDAAIAESRKAIKRDAKHPLAYTTLGLVYFGKQDYDQAAEYLKKAVATEPEYATPMDILRLE